MPGVIKVNPSVFTDKRDAMAVVVNEALRLFQEDVRFSPKFEVTPEQVKFFRNTAYADDADAMKKTILARIATRDTSIPNPTPEQVAETKRLLGLVMEAIGESHPDFALMRKLADGLGASAPESAPAPEGGTPQDAAGAGEVMPGPPPVVYPERDIRGDHSVRSARPQPSAKDVTVSKVLDALPAMESGGDPDAIGDQGRAVGALQQWKVSVDEANRIVGKQLWSYEDRTNPQLQRAMAKVVMERHFDRGVTDPVALAGRWRNPHGDAPSWYLDKARKALGAKVAIK